MAYKLLLLNFDRSIVGEYNAPLYNGFQGRDEMITGAKAEYIYLDDTNQLFEPIDSEGQGLLVDHEIGGEVYPAGTRLGVIEKDAYVLLQDNFFYTVSYPAIVPAGGGSPQPEPSGTSVLIFPAEQGKTAPDFDITRPYQFAYQQFIFPPLPQVDIPPEYLDPSCFSAGTLIETDSGAKRVEDLVAGDLVRTRDRGFCALKWVGGSNLSARALDISPHLRPIRIRSGALGDGLPSRDLIVSPQHRVLVRSTISRRIAGADETLVAAKHLLDLPGIDVVRDAGGVGYYHLLFDTHQVVMSNGCRTESLHTGPQAMNALSPAARREIRAIFPELFAQSHPPRVGARPFLRRCEATELVRRHVKNQKPIFA